MNAKTLRRWRLLLAATLALAALCVPCQAKGSAHSYKVRSSFGGHRSSSSSHHATSRTYSDSYRPRTSAAPKLRRTSLTSPRVQVRRSVSAGHITRRVPRLHASSTPRAYYKSAVPKHRSESAKQQFLRQHGLKRVPPGYEVDHTVPLSAGGSDTPANMELLPKSAHHAKTAAEAKRYGWHKKR